MGMVNYLLKFLPNLAEVSKPLRELMSDKVDWMWREPQSEAFCRIKNLIVKAPVLSLYDPTKPLRISADASSFAIGAVLEQFENEIWKPVYYASRSLSQTEARYAQIEREALALTWACERFRMYIYGLPFRLRTDHKPLVPILNCKPIGELSARLQRFRMRLANYAYTVEYISGKKFFIPDTLSRYPGQKSAPTERDILEEQLVEVMVVSEIEHARCSAQRLVEICEGQKLDPVCIQIRQFVESDWPDFSKTSGFYKDRSMFTVHEDVLMYGKRLVIPKSLRQDVLGRLHCGH